MSLETIKCSYSNLYTASHHSEKTPNFLKLIVKILKKYKIIRISSKFSRLWNNDSITDLNTKLRLLRELCEKLKLHPLSDQRIVALLHDRRRQKRLLLSIYVTYREKIYWLTSKQENQLQNFINETKPRLSEFEKKNKRDFLKKIEAFKHRRVYSKESICSTEPKSAETLFSQMDTFDAKFKKCSTQQMTYKSLLEAQNQVLLLQPEYCNPYKTKYILYELTKTKRHLLKTISIILDEICENALQHFERGPNNEIQDTVVCSKMEQKYRLQYEGGEKLVGLESEHLENVKIGREMVKEVVEEVEARITEALEAKMKKQFASSFLNFVICKSV